MSQHVASAATSDEPYRLSNTLWGSWLRKDAAKSTRSASPLLVQYLRCGSWSQRLLCVLRRRRKRDGTSTIRVICSLLSVEMSRCGLVSTSSAIRITLIPWSRGPNSSQTASTKLNEVFWQQISSASKGKHSHIQCRRLSVARCVARTPLGLPVE